MHTQELPTQDHPTDELRGAPAPAPPPYAPPPAYQVPPYYPSPPGRAPVGRRRWGPVVATVLALLLFVGAAGFYFVARSDSTTSDAARSVVISQSDTAPPRSSTANMVDRVLPSVVNIRTTTVSSDPLGGAQEGRAEGSGVVIDRNGIILTNNHVVEGAVSVKVVFGDGHGSMTGRVLGTDPQRDLAVVKVDASDLKPITVGRSGELSLGDTVVALGFPLGLGGPTVTRGIVSGLDRTIDVGGSAAGTEHLEGVLQTDAAINPGNSGGALVNSAGQLVGINTAAASAGAAENVGFAIAIDEALPVVKQIITTPPEQQAWLGVQVATIDSDATAADAGLPAGSRGALVVGTIPDSPAAAAGLEQGDLIVAIDDTTVDSSPALTEALADLSPGDSVQVRVVGSSGQRPVSLTLAQRPQTFATPQE